MEKCSVCFQPVETDIFIPPDECVKLFNNCLSSLHSSITENFKNKIPFVYGSQLPFCKKCFDSALQLNQANEQLSAFQKQLTDLTVEFSLSVLHRRSQTTCVQKSKIEIDVTGLPDDLFYCNNLENASDEESRVLEDMESKILVENENPVVLSPQHNERRNDVRELLEYSSEIEQENLFTFQNQNPFDENNVKSEYNNDGSTNSITGNNICFTSPGKTVENAHCLIGNSIVVEMKAHSSTDFELVEFENDPLSLTKDQPKKIRKITKNRLLSSQPGNIQVNKSQRRSPSISIKGVGLRKIGVNKRRPANQLKSEGTSSHSQKSLLNYSDGRKKTDKITLQRKSKNDGPQAHSFPCEFCNKVFKTKNDIQNHTHTHTGERPYQCPFCSKAFKQTAHLAVHKRTHTGERPHKCPYCSKTFITASNRRAHQLSHHGGSRYKCNLCLKTFNAESTWQKHSSSCHPK